MDYQASLTTYPSNSVRVTFLNFAFYELTDCLHVLKIGCYFRWFKQILGRTRPSVRVHWVACGTCSVPGNFFQVGVCSARSDWLIVTGPRADYGLAKTKQQVIKKPYNKILTNRASLSRTGEYWPWVVFVRTSLRSVRTATTSGQY